MGVKLISDIINRSEDDWQKKFITQVPAIEWHVKEYPVYIKNVLNKCKWLDFQMKENKYGCFIPHAFTLKTIENNQ